MTELQTVDSQVRGCLSLKLGFKGLTGSVPILLIFLS